jgi:ribosomal protein L37AE/L43A
MKALYEYRCPECNTKNIDFDPIIGWQCFECNGLQWPKVGKQILITEQHEKEKRKLSGIKL